MKNMSYININDMIVLNGIHKILQIKIKKYIYKKKSKNKTKNINLYCNGIIINISYLISIVYKNKRYFVLM